MKKKTDYTELQCKNFLERGYNIVLTQWKDGRPEDVYGPNKYYGMSHEVSIWPSVRYVPTGLCIQNLVTDFDVYNGQAEREDFTILFCNPKSKQKLTVNGWTLDLSRYNRDQVMDFLRKHGLKVESDQVKV